MEYIKERIIKILVEVKENTIKYEDVTNESKIIDEIGLDSLEMINFVLLTEEEFNLDIDFEDFDFIHLTSVNTFGEFIKVQISQKVGSNC